MTTLTKPACNIPPWPELKPLALSDQCTEDAVCLTLESTAALIDYITQVRNVQAVIAKCPNVQVNTDSAPPQ